ncbi:MAG: sulfite exporter TauE/SafE family protein [Dongiaceae bacterium]
MQIYLPIAEISLNILLLLSIGGAVGLLSGMFGVGGGFLLTPILIFIGVPPAIAVATQANQVVGSSVSGVLAHWSKDNVDFKMGFVLVAGGFIGSTVGVVVFGILQRLNQIDLVIQFAYVILLTGIGGLMLFESLRAILRLRRRTGAPRKLHQHIWVHGLPLKMRFRRSRLYISALLPLVLGFVIGILSAIMGIGGAFLMVPAMIYLLGMPTRIVVGTSLFQTIFVTVNVTFLQAVQNQTVDVILAFVLLVGGVIGAQVGGRIGARLSSEYLRVALAALVLFLGINLSVELAATPAELYSLTPVEDVP